MAESYFLLAATFIPLLLAPVAYGIGRKAGVNAATWFSFGILAVSTALLLIPAIGIYNGQQQTYVESYVWGQFGNFGLRLDGLSLPFALIIYILCTVLALYSKPYMVHKVSEDLPEHKAGHNGDSNGPVASAGNDHSSHGSSPNISSSQQLTVLETDQRVKNQIALYFSLYLAFSMGMLGTVLATNLIEFYVFFELMLVPSFFLVAFYGYGARRRIALMFFFWTHVGAVVLLLGLLAMGFFAGGFDFDTIRANAGNIPAQWLPLIVFALVIGLGVKLAAFLVHIWLPYAHAEAPTPISALLSPAMIGIGAYGLLRLWMELLGGTGAYEQYSLYINMWGLATMIYGGAMALMQDDIKKVLAYSSISQMGYILFGLGAESVLGITGGTLMYVTHGLGKAILFMMAGSIILQTGTRSMTKLGGLAGKMPYTAVLAMIGALTIIGIPPTSGFMGEWILFNGMLQTAATDMDPLRTTMFGLGILATVLSSAYILWMFKRIFFGKIPEELAHVKDSNRYITVTMAVFAAMTLIIGVYPDLFLAPIDDYINGMFEGNSEVLPVPVHIEESENSGESVVVAPPEAATAGGEGGH
ncbi:NADH-quinone oxidoreductase subunit M [Candidatus Nitrososphaera gargensis Ga9.2]|uniref:NADH-quinone oxidoreductase subunit M n=1 Tax=Nitrososphaera gargensis (strain Ga9.2) TaxID=1237085 RepID=K0IE98_NITGG|nr:NADH-quinone oxidoreductase subunit M [Candidatus Nitrososphaera gargensis]AFU58100.1 NADH-quinone oxidoreductase subunit M [Candidatus Nitrososphaera gargensis Ga9.2]